MKLAKFILSEKFILKEADDTVSSTAETLTSTDYTTAFEQLIQSGHTELNSQTISTLSDFWEFYCANVWGKAGIGKHLASLGTPLSTEALKLGFNLEQNPFLAFLRNTASKNKLALINQQNYQALHNAVVRNTLAKEDLTTAWIGGGRLGANANLLNYDNLYSKTGTEIGVYCELINVKLADKLTTDYIGSIWSGKSYTAADIISWIINANNEATIKQLIDSDLAKFGEAWGKLDFKKDAVTNLSDIAKITLTGLKTIAGLLAKLDIPLDDKITPQKVSIDTLKAAAKEVLGLSADPTIDKIGENAWLAVYLITAYGEIAGKTFKDLLAILTSKSISSGKTPETEKVLKAFKLFNPATVRIQRDQFNQLISYILPDKPGK